MKVSADELMAAAADMALEIRFKDRLIDKLTAELERLRGQAAPPEETP
jgi:hypothetical protein